MARPVGIAETRPYLPELESLRGLAMLLVLLFHLDALIQGGLLQAGGEIVSPALAYVRAGHTGVNLFFILSAFLLSLPFLSEAAGEKTVSVRGYFSRRALRILPLYYCAVVAAAVLSASTTSDLLRGLPYLFFLQSFAHLATPLPPYSNVWWSLATEAQFYLLLPLLPLARGAARGRAYAALALWAVTYTAFVLQRLPVFHTVHAELRFGLSIIGRAPMFLTGIAAAWLYLHHGDALRRRLANSPVARGGGADVLLLVVLLALGFLLRWLVWVGAGTARQPAFHVRHFIEAPLWGAVVLLLLLAPLRLRAVFSNRFLNRLGVLSYSVYVLHTPVIEFSLRFLRQRDRSLVGWNLRTALVAPLLCVLCFALAELTYRGIERPFLVRKQRLPS